jgi:hypothetical protein
VALSPQGIDAGRIIAILPVEARTVAAVSAASFRVLSGKADPLPAMGVLPRLGAAIPSMSIAASADGRSRSQTLTTRQAVTSLFSADVRLAGYQRHAPKSIRQRNSRSSAYHGGKALLD